MKKGLLIVNTGNGSSFQTGLDVAQLARDKEALRRSSRQTRDAELRMTAWHCGVTKPVIAAVNGVCAGGTGAFIEEIAHRLDVPVLPPGSAALSTPPLEPALRQSIDQLAAAAHLMHDAVERIDTSRQQFTAAWSEFKSLVA